MHRLVRGGDKASDTAATPVVQPEDERQPVATVLAQLGGCMRADGISEAELTRYLRQKQTTKGKPLLLADEELPGLAEPRLAKLLSCWQDLCREVVALCRPPFSRGYAE